MKAFVRSEYCPSQDIELVDIPTPQPAADEILVRLAASSVNMADVDYLLGRPKIARLGTGLRKPRNHRLGLDVAGTVEAAGENVTRFKPGDEVIGDLTSHGFGAFAEYACASADAFAPKPAGITFEEAAAIPQAGVMALQGLIGKGPVKPGQKVLINGAGGNVGPFAVQIAKAFGAEVTGVDHTDKLEMIQSIGADHVIDYTKQDYTKTGKRYDRIFDMAAFHSIFATRRSLAPGGVYVMIPGTVNQLLRLLVTPILSLLGSRKVGMLRWRPFGLDDVATLTGLIEAGRVKPYIDRVYRFEEIPAALQHQFEGRSRGKLVVRM
jgi:NADPH:quinone reductase-like Zn-dependent oxidoreductase